MIQVVCFTPPGTRAARPQDLRAIAAAMNAGEGSVCTQCSVGHDHRSTRLIWVSYPNGPNCQLPTA